MSRSLPPHPLPAVELFDDHPGPRGPTLLDWLRLALAAARRRKVLVALSFLACLSAFAAWYALKPPTYRVETRVLTLDRLALPTAARSVYEESPARSAWDLVHRRGNLVALLRRTGLVAAGDRDDPPGGAARPGDPVARPDGPAAQGGAADEELDALVTLLDRRIDVSADHGTITLTVDWGDPGHAYALAQAALDSFLEARHLQEVSAIEEVISVLQGHTAKLRGELDAAIEESERRAASHPRPAVARVRQPSEELVGLQSLLAARQRALQDLEEIRRRRLADLQAQLDQARNTLSEAHPTVMGLRREIAAASIDSPQIQAARQEEQDVRRRTAARLAREGFGAAALAAPAAAPAVAPAAREEDPRVRQAQAQYDQMSARLNAARVELDTARAAFKYRYNVVWPPQLPDEPVSPNGPKIFGIGLLASIVAALLVAIAPDVLAGRIVHRIQVERSLGVPVLGELDRPS